MWRRKNRVAQFVATNAGKGAKNSGAGLNGFGDNVGHFEKSEKPGGDSSKFQKIGYF
jgi:hypothetical protein